MWSMYEVALRNVLHRPDSVVQWKGHDLNIPPATPIDELERTEEEDLGAKDFLSVTGAVSYKKKIL